MITKPYGPWVLPLPLFKAIYRVSHVFKQLNKFLTDLVYIETDILEFIVIKKSAVYHFFPQMIWLKMMWINSENITNFTKISVVYHAFRIIWRHVIVIFTPITFVWK